MTSAGSVIPENKKSTGGSASPAPGMDTAAVHYDRADSRTPAEQLQAALNLGVGVLTIESHGASTGAPDNTAAIQSAINAAAVSGKVLVSGPGVFLVSQLSLPSSLTWLASGTVLKAVPGSNRAVLVNRNQTFNPASVQDVGIAIHGLTVDHDGVNQSDAESGGVWNCPVRITGAKSVTLDGFTVLRQRRFAITLVNVDTATVNASIIADNAVVSSNRDGLHINGNSRNIDARLYCENLNDDALALNADDGDYGGGYSGANVAGPIENVRASVFVKNCYQGVRLLSALNPIRHCRLALAGDTSKTGVLIESFSLGSSSLYTDIVFENIDLDFKATVSGLYAPIHIDTSTQAANTRSDFTFERVTYRGNGGISHHVIMMHGKDTALTVGNLTAIAHGFTGHKAVFIADGCTSGVDIAIDSLVMKKTNNPTTAYPLQSKDSTLESLVVRYMDVDNVCIGFIGYSTSAGNPGLTRNLSIYAPKASAINADKGVFNLGDWHSVTLAHVAGPNVLTDAGFAAGKRWGISAYGGTIAKHSPSYLTTTTANRPAGCDDGTCIFDTTLNKPIWRSGAAWKDATGATV